MQIGDLVIFKNEWVELNPWMQTIFAEWGKDGVGLVVKVFGHDNHHIVVLINGTYIQTSKTKLEALCK